MQRTAALGLIVAAALTGCSPKPPPGVDVAVLDEAIANSIGDPTTCVIVVRKGSGEIVYRYGRQLTCGTQIPSCQGAAITSVDALAKEAAKGVTRTVSCPSPAGGVGIALGPVPTTRAGEFAYAAGMNSPHVLPGIEIARRLDGAFARGGF
jgi:hypothetical protein